MGVLKFGSDISDSLPSPIFVNHDRPGKSGQEGPLNKILLKNYKILKFIFQKIAGKRRWNTQRDQGIQDRVTQKKLSGKE